MPTEVSLKKLESIQSDLTNLYKKNENFYQKLASILKMTRGIGANRFKSICRKIAFNSENPNPNDKLLQFDFELLDALQLEYPAAYSDFSSFLRNCNGTGYDNILSLMLGETPLEIKTYGKYDDYRRSRR